MNKDILEGRILIDDFMGYTVTERIDEYKVYVWKNKTHYVVHECHREEGEYHTSWDWLMPVVEKIEKKKGVHFVISELGCDIYSFGKHISNCREETKILTVWQAVVEFIKWYNQNKIA